MKKLLLISTIVYTVLFIIGLMIWLPLAIFALVGFTIDLISYIRLRKGKQIFTIIDLINKFRSKKKV